MQVVSLVQDHIYTLRNAISAENSFTSLWLRFIRLFSLLQLNINLNYYFKTFFVKPVKNTTCNCTVQDNITETCKWR